MVAYSVIRQTVHSPTQAMRWLIGRVLAVQCWAFGFELQSDIKKTIIPEH